MSLEEVKAYYFTKHYCKLCNEKLIRNKEEEFLEEGWDTVNGNVFYGKKYKITISLKCPKCLRIYRIEDL